MTVADSGTDRHRFQLLVRLEKVDCLALWGRWTAGQNTSGTIHASAATKGGHAAFATTTPSARRPLSAAGSCGRGSSGCLARVRFEAQRGIRDAEDAANDRDVDRDVGRHFRPKLLVGVGNFDDHRIGDDVL